MRRDLLFFIILGAFVVAFGVTIAGITGFLPLDEKAKGPLIAALIVELALGVLALFKKTDFFAADDQAKAQKHNREITTLVANLSAMRLELESARSTIEALEKARAREVLGRQSDYVKLTEAKDAADEKLAQYKIACAKDLATLKTKIEELGGSSGSK